MTLRVLAFALTLSTSAHAAPPEWPLQTFEDVRAEWVRVVTPLPQKPSKCHDFARWLCAAQAVAARSRSQEPNVRGCLAILDDAREMDRSPAKRKWCATSFRGAVIQARRFEAAMHEAGRANGARLPKPDARWRAVVRAMSFMAILANAFEGNAI